MSACLTPPAISEDLLRRYDIAGPRYTSYPTADRFVEAFTVQQYEQALAQRASGALVGGSAPLSLYVHIPFCESVCYYCACNKVITRHHERAGEYLQALRTEMDLTLGHLGRMPSVSQLHLGGGSPTFLSDEELGQLMQDIQQRFRVAPGAEISIEVDPRTVSAERLRHLRGLGFNRLSFGVQDFDPAVQKAVHRLQSFEDVQALMQGARELGFESINVDLIYGLPLQTAASFQRTIAQVCELRPDRIALYGYAHLPQRFKPQRRIDIAQLPAAGDKLAMLSAAIGGFLAQGYTYIGMDHFALPNDALSVAKRQGRLHRNFQGYSTQADCDMIGLGVSSIGRVGVTYSQNAKTLYEYYDLLRQGQLPVNRGLALNRDDLVRRAMIMALMCQGRVAFESIELAHLIKVPDYFRAELEQLRPLEEAGMVQLSADAIEVTALGWYFVRAVAMVFDRYLQADRTRAQFSKII
ncbi:oxygen-independent coproporphyrinogen III oxidase [Kinneretia asaccharophila]|uniref:Coproporphyrinogen-III oxidase n=1 Tax=Roseateles asaccharophilus TaxID=582607 RepID=A0A4R6N8F3_9BURK|nr:oxygen-independent coproporphyrinogen III oxidase [Roseateles asaccharophilus]MDN3543781.1 oxygen-independent coproporphyrinogen III oxidase [Roseateles asaccharophilus]TDP11841.1 oxygen-independent coproporphyrinogen-3 oxidase [Roseateles asaccharophilus]